MSCDCDKCSDAGKAEAIIGACIVLAVVAGILIWAALIGYLVSR